MFRVNREQFLSELDVVTAGLSSREIFVQSSCFVFKGGYVYTYNEEVACCQKTCLNIEGAVLAEKLLTLLRQLTDKILHIDVRKGELHIKGKGKWEAGFVLEKEIKLPIESIKKPKKWKSLPDKFLDAVSMVGSCVGTDETQFHLTCVHLHPNWVEACDNFRLSRFTLDTKLKSPILIRKEALKYVVLLGMNKFGKTKHFLHFFTSKIQVD